MGRPSKGSIRNRGPYQYRAAVTIEGREETKTFSNETAARSWIAQRLDAEAAGKSQQWLASRQMTLGSALRKYLQEVTPSKKSKQSEENRIKCFLRRETELCEITLYELRTSDLKALIIRRTRPSNPTCKPVSGSTMNRELAVISHLFVTAQSEWEMEGLRNPVVRGLRRKESRGRNRRLEEGEEAALLAAARDYERRYAPEVPITAVAQFALATGMRLGEIGRCRWANVDLHQATVFLDDTKNGEARTVPLYPSIVRLLSSLERRDDGLVFGRAECIRLMWTRVLARTDIKGLRFHDLRHEAISRFFEETDLSDMEIAMISGHKTLIMLKRYAHLRANKLARKLAVAEGGEELKLVVGRPTNISIDGASLPESVLKRRQWKVVSSSAVVLKTLVLAKPVSTLAAEFGVSDAAIHKACERLGIEKPPRGFWLRSKAA